MENESKARTKDKDMTETEIKRGVNSSFFTAARIQYRRNTREKTAVTAAPMIGNRQNPNSTKKSYRVLGSISMNRLHSDESWCCWSFTIVVGGDVPVNGHVEDTGVVHVTECLFAVDAHGAHDNEREYENGAQTGDGQ